MAGTATVDLERSLNGELQRSEYLRIALVTGVLVFTAAMAVVRHLTGGEVMQGTTIQLTLAVVGFAIGGGVAVMVVVRRAIRTGRILPTWFWAATIALECSLPTVILAVVGKHSVLSPLDAVSSPSMVLYAVFAVASVLRLRPWLCLLGAAVVVAEHGALTVWALAKTEGPVRGEVAPGLAYTLGLGMSWVVAAFVAEAVRRHVVAGLREARTEAELAGLRDKLDMARQIQAGLLPREPLKAGMFEIVGFNRPADETGGDYFDWMVLPDGRVAVLIADVTGHGIGPAILMAVCRAYARATVPREAPVTQALSSLNAMIAADFVAGRFVTLALAIVNPKTGEVELLSAGHGPTLLFRAGKGDVEMFGGDGPPLGVVEDAYFDHPTRFRMEPGDSLLLTTDGFVETARADGRLYRTEGLAESFRRHAGQATTVVLARLDEDRERFAGGEPQRDDVTAVLVRCTRAPAG